jgi:hypothetical protein
MNSIQKQNTIESSSSYEDFLISFEKKLIEMENVFEVELLMKKLQFLGLNFDPFQDEIGNDCCQIMEQLGNGMIDHMRNPYLATNIVLRLLDRTEERLNNLKQ